MASLSRFLKLRRPGAVAGLFLSGLLVPFLATEGQTIDPTQKDQFTDRLIPKTTLKVAFTVGPKYPKEGQIVQFTDATEGNPLSWRWTFGDGSTSTKRSPTHVYTSSGFKKVMLEASDGAFTRRSSRTITVLPATVTASFTFTPSTPGPGQQVSFSDKSTGAPTSWLWDFGDGQTSAIRNPSHVYVKAGLFTVTLLSGDASGSSKASRTISVASLYLLTASFNYSPTPPIAGQVVQFTDMSAGGPTSWSWDFGDHGTSATKNPAHTYQASGSYTVTLTVKNSSESRSTSRVVSVVASAVPTAGFTFDPPSPVAGQSIIFTDGSSGNPTSWLWDFGDGTSGTGRNSSHTYTNAGSYNVQLSASNASGTGSIIRAVNVLPLGSLSADFVYSPAAPVLGQAVTFADRSTGLPTSWLWEFGDGATSTQQNPNHAYSASGAHSVTLTVASGSNSSRVSKTLAVGHADVITATSPSLADVSAAIAMAKPGDTVMVPAGQAIWDSQLVITKGIKLIGAGIGQTVVTGNFVPSELNRMSYKSWLVVYKPSNPELNEPFRLSGFEFDAGQKSYGIFLTNLTLHVIDQVRVDHTKVINCYGSRPFSIYGTVYGVADNNEWYGCYISACDARDGATWATFAFDFGTSKNFYYEDNKFIGVNYLVLRSEMGGRWCARHNLIDGRNVASGLYSLMDLHGNAPSAHWAAMGAEIYENVIMGPDNGGNLMDQRGGKALIYNNQVTCAGSFGTKVREEFSDADNPTAGPSQSPSGQPQHVSDSYYWGNRKNTTKIMTPYVGESVDYGGLLGLVPQANREFWTESVLFDGTSGVGVGTLAERPQTCVKGVAYWATDTKTLYRCLADNTWEPFYVPYAYPHPLREKL